MKKLIVLVIVFSFGALLGTRVTGGLQQLSQYGGETLDISKACLSGGLECEGLVLVYTGKTALNGLYVAQSGDFQDAVSPQPKTYDPSLVEDVELVQ